MCITLYCLLGDYLVDELSVVGYFVLLFLYTLHAPGHMPPPPNQNVLGECIFQARLRKKKYRTGKIKLLIL